MKNFKFLFMMLMGVGLLVSSCGKDKEADEIINNLMKGSVDLTIDGVKFNKIATNVNHSLSDDMVGCYVLDISAEGSFILGFGPVPAVGETVECVFDSGDDDAPVVTVMGSFNPDLPEEIAYLSKSGTIKRVSTDKFVLDVVLVGMSDQTIEHILKGTVVAGVTE